MELPSNDVDDDQSKAQERVEPTLNEKVFDSTNQGTLGNATFD